jgi:dTDP-4-dehydrorhamnose reductase
MADILVTGGRGQVGLDLARQDWPENVRLFFPTRDELDITSGASIGAYFAGRRLSAVINAAAYTAVDKAESEAGMAFLANEHGPTLLANATRDAGIPLVHLSTDYVFDGAKSGPYVEDDLVAPLGIYGASKCAGEEAVLKGNARSVVLRTAWVISAHRDNFLKTMLRAGATNPVLRIVDDQIGCPTSAQDIACTLRTIVLRMIDDDAAPAGIFHFVNAGAASWYDLGREIFAVSAVAGGPVPRVEAITTAEYSTQARRPPNSRLATAKITAHYGVYPRHWRVAVRDIVNELLGPGGPDRGIDQ